MSLDFSFDLISKGWKLCFSFRGDYLNHKSTTSNTKGYDVWKDLAGNKVVELLLTQGKTTLIDFDNLDRVCESNWCAGKDSNWGFRVIRGSVKGQSQLLHRELHHKHNLTTDHINEDFPDSYALDNRKINIRYTDKNTHNVRKYKSNKSGHSNILHYKKGDKWVVQVRLDKKSPYAPYYDIDQLQSAITCRNLFKIVLHKHRGHNTDSCQYRKHKELIIRLYDKVAIPTTKPEKDVMELFKQINKKKSLHLREKIDSLRDKE